MIKTDRDALVCDMAETYHIYDMHQFPVDYIATLAAGLHEESRIMMKIRNQKLSLNTYINAFCADLLQYLLWTKTKDAEKGRNKPKSLIEVLTHEPESEYEAMSYEDFKEFRKKMING